MRHEGSAPGNCHRFLIFPNSLSGGRGPRDNRPGCPYPIKYVPQKHAPQKYVPQKYVP
ncbi:hypothetical protein GCM10010357_20290 [Streptomyces luteireticuli]|uniref:Uncharacterized protein n=1 Tax=Streptomyces luteireticuli TaxID=173858 RepID=A0ABN0YL42_9ACTN